MTYTRVDWIAKLMLFFYTPQCQYTRPRFNWLPSPYFNLETSTSICLRDVWIITSQCNCQLVNCMSRETDFRKHQKHAILITYTRESRAAIAKHGFATRIIINSTTAEICLQKKYYQITGDEIWRYKLNSSEIFQHYHHISLPLT